MTNDYEDNDTAVGVNLRRLRLKAQLTQQELAERIGWQRIAMAQAESGKRRFRIDDLARLCVGLGVSYRALLVGQEDTMRALDPYREKTQQLLVKALGDGTEEEPTVNRRRGHETWNMTLARMASDSTSETWRRQLMHWADSLPQVESPSNFEQEGSHDE